MLTVTLKPDKSEQVENAVRESSTTPDELVDQALELYFEQYERIKIRAEQKEFEKQRAALLAHYPGEYIAMHKGRVIDHDRSVGALHNRVFAQLGRTPVLLKRVTAEPDRELVFRSQWRLEKI